MDFATKMKILRNSNPSAPAAYVRDFGTVLLSDTARHDPFGQLTLMNTVEPVPNCNSCHLSAPAAPTRYDTLRHGPSLLSLFAHVKHRPGKPSQGNERLRKPRPSGNQANPPSGRKEWITNRGKAGGGPPHIKPGKRATTPSISWNGPSGLTFFSSRSMFGSPEASL